MHACIQSLELIDARRHAQVVARRFVSFVSGLMGMFSSAHVSIEGMGTPKGSSYFACSVELGAQVTNFAC